MGDDGAACEEGPSQVDVDHAVPILDRDVGDRPELEHPGSVHQAREVTCFRDLGDEGLDGRGIGDV
jgi:hypothetical protein